MDHKGYAQIEKAKKLGRRLYGVSILLGEHPADLARALVTDQKLRRKIAETCDINYPSTEVVELTADLLTWAQGLTNLSRATTYPSPV